MLDEPALALVATRLPRRFLANARWKPSSLVDFRLRPSEARSKPLGAMVALRKHQRRRSSGFRWTIPLVDSHGPT